MLRDTDGIKTEERVQTAKEKQDVFFASLTLCLVVSSFHPVLSSEFSPPHAADHRANQIIRCKSAENEDTSAPVSHVQAYVGKRNHVLSDPYCKSGNAGSCARAAPSSPPEDLSARVLSARCHSCREHCLYLFRFFATFFAALETVKLFKSPLLDSKLFFPPRELFQVLRCFVNKFICTRIRSSKRVCRFRTESIPGLLDKDVEASLTYSVIYD